MNEDLWYDQHIHPDDRARYDAMFDEGEVRAGSQFEVSYRLVRGDGRVFEVVERARARCLPDGRVLLEGSVADVTEERVARARAAEVEERLQRLMEAVEEVVYTAEFDDDGNPQHGVPRAWLAQADRRPGAVRAGVVDVPRAHRSRTTGRSATSTSRDLRSGRQASRVYRLHGLDGVTRWIWARAYPRPRADGEPLQFDGVLSDISERHQVAEELRIARDEAQRRSRVDALTEVFNRAHFVEELTHELDRAAREGETPAVLMLDLDYFKRVNDTFLHAGGDIVLQEVARRIAGAVRGYDTVARWGGEEFVVLLPTIRDDDSLRRIAEKVRLAISAEPIPFGDDALAVTASAGAARAGIGRFTAESLVDAADRALYSAKRRGRDRLRLYGELTESDFLMEEPDAIRIAEAMSRSASVREGVSDLHCAHVADLAARVAEHLSLGATAVLRCRLGGWLHDLGKVAIPDRILSKASALTDDEWAVMRTHRGAGGRDRRPHPGSCRRGAGGAPSPRALRRRRLSRRAGGRRDPDRGADRRRGRHVERDDRGARLPHGPRPGRGAGRARAFSRHAARPGRGGGPEGRPGRLPGTSLGRHRPRRHLTPRARSAREPRRRLAAYRSHHRPRTRPDRRRRRIGPSRARPRDPTG